MLRFALATFLASVCLFSFTCGAPVDSAQGSNTLLYSTLNSLKQLDKGLVTCTFCQDVVNDVIFGFDNNQSDEEISSGIGNRCERLNVYNFKVCYGTAITIMPTIRYMYFNLTGLIPGNICGIFLQGQNCGLSDSAVLEWTIPPSSVPKPPVTEWTQPPTGSPTTKVLHLADVHWDPEYLEGSNSACNDPLCCRATSGEVVNASDAAGYWGNYGVCDMPWRTIEKAVASMASQHPDVSYIVWTGDLTPHDVWSTDKEENVYIIDQLLGLIAQYFPNVPVYPTLGNHESHPVNTFAPPEITDADFNTAWLYNEADLQWARWLPAEASETIRYGGYYTALVQPGLRIVSMNMNYCYTYNWWTLWKSQDPASMLLWFNQVLEQAEAAGEKVHVLSHIPPGNGDCWTIFSREYQKIINRFESTVAAQFYGHTHNDEYKIFYDLVEIERPINVAFVAPSLTTYSDLNPGYRVYTIDGPRSGASWAVLDHTNFYFSIPEANAQGPNVDPAWSQLYSAKQEYGLTDLSPRSMDEFFQRLVADNNLFQLYFKNHVKAGDPKMAEGCNNRCRSKLLCFIVTTDPADQTRCDQIRRELIDLHSEV